MCDGQMDIHGHKTELYQKTKCKVYSATALAGKVIPLQRTLIITRVFVTKDFAVKSNLLL